MEPCDIKTKMPSTHYTQTDGLSETINRIIENYLQCYCFLRQDDWTIVFLLAAKNAYNSSNSEQLQVTSSETNLGYNPRGLLDVVFPTDMAVESVTQFNSMVTFALDAAKFLHELFKGCHAVYNAKTLEKHSYEV